MSGAWDINQVGLPSGWEAKFDSKIGRYYFIDHSTKQTTWEDPRLRTCPPPPPYTEAGPSRTTRDKNLSNNSVSQPPWMSPCLGNRSYSPLSGYGVGNLPPSHPGFGQTVLQDVTNLAGGITPYGTPIMGTRVPTILHDCKEEIEFSVSKISAMFQTVPESHIWDLMKKYHNREAVVISALQVQKFPLAIQTSVVTSTPPPSRHFLPAAAAFIALQQGAKPHQVVPSDALPFQPQAPPAIVSSIATHTHVPIQPIYEVAKGTHLLEERTNGYIPDERISLARTSIPGQRSSVDQSIGSPGHYRSSLERSIGSPKPGRDSPLYWSRTSSPRTTRSISEVTRSFMGSPRQDFRSSPRPSPHSPKIKLRYLKGLFPKVEPTELLDVLTSNCYNVKDACEELVTRGHTKKNFELAPPKLKEETKNREDERKAQTPLPSPMIIRPKNLTEEFKKNVKSQLGKAFPILTPTVVNMALQTAFYDETRAREILDKMNENERLTQETLAQITPKLSRRLEPPTVPISGVSPPRLRRERTIRPVLHRPRMTMAWTNSASPVSRSNGTDEDESKFKSKNCTRAHGPKIALHSGPSEALLLTDYIPWHGPNIENIRISESLSKGPNLSLRKGPKGIAYGPDSAKHKGPAGIAKGSQFVKIIKKEVTFSTKQL